MLRFDGAGWQSPGTSGHTDGFAAGPDGELWRAFVDPDAHADIDPDPESEDLSGDWIGLARLDADGWTTFGAADGVSNWGRRGGVLFAVDLLEIGPDGTVRVNAARQDRDCDGVASFDGVDWTPYLEGRCVHDIAVSAEGGLWVRAHLDGMEEDVGTFVILPGEEEGTASDE